MRRRHDGRAAGFACTYWRFGSSLKVFLEAERWRGSQETQDALTPIGCTLSYRHLHTVCSATLPSVRPLRARARCCAALRCRARMLSALLRSSLWR